MKSTDTTTTNEYVVVNEFIPSSKVLQQTKEYFAVTPVGIPSLNSTGIEMKQEAYLALTNGNDKLRCCLGPSTISEGGPTVLNLKARRRHVTFSEVVNLRVYERPRLWRRGNSNKPRQDNEDDAGAIWYTLEDVEQFRRAALQESKIIRCNAGGDRRFVQEIHMSREIASRLAETMSNDEAFLNVVMRNMKMSELGLSFFHIHCRDYRGLERYASLRLRKRIIETKAQNRALAYEFGQCISESNLCNLSQAISRESRVFARMIGLVDELAASEVYKED